MERQTIRFGINESYMTDYFTDKNEREKIEHYLDLDIKEEAYQIISITPDPDRGQLIVEYVEGPQSLVDNYVF